MGGGFPLRKKAEQLTVLHSHYDSLIQNVKINLVENEETINEVMKETKTSTDELSTLVLKVSFHV